MLCSCGATVYCYAFCVCPNDFFVEGGSRGWLLGREGVLTVCGT